jgi:hypothetical protein
VEVTPTDRTEIKNVRSKSPPKMSNFETEKM